MNNRWVRIIPGVLALLLVMLACQMNLGGPTAPTERPAATQPANWRSSLDSAQPGQEISVTISEGEINNLLPGEVQAGQGITVTDPSIVIAPSGIQAYGQASSETISARFRADLDVKVDEGGRPRVEVTGADIGPMPVPDSMLNELSTAVNNAMLEALGPAIDNLRLTDITLLDGALQITGIPQ